MRVSFLELRVPPVAVVLVAGLLMWSAALALPMLGVHPPGRTILALLTIAAGAVIAAAGVFEFRRARTTVKPLKPDAASSLVDGGVYRLTRNPMYLGMAARAGHRLRRSVWNYQRRVRRWL